MAGVDRTTPAATQSQAEADRGVVETITERFDGLLWYVGSAVALLACLIVCLIVWEPGMAFPAEWGKPIGTKVDEWILWFTLNASWFLDGIKNVITKVLVTIEDILLWIPWPVVILGVALTAWKVSGRNMALFATAALLLVGLMGRLPGGTSTLWEGSMETLALIFVSVSISLIIGIPLGIIGARNSFADSATSRRSWRR